MYAKTIVRERRIPLSLDLNAVPNQVTLKAMDDVFKHKNIQGPYDSIDELIKEI